MVVGCQGGPPKEVPSELKDEKEAVSEEPRFLRQRKLHVQRAWGRMFEGVPERRLR